jgi:hypothetical protein
MDAKTRMPVRTPDPHGLSGGAMFGVVVNSATLEGKPAPKLIGIMTDCHAAENEIFGSSIAIALAIVKGSWGTDLPPRVFCLRISKSGSRSLAPLKQAQAERCA